MKPTKPDPVRLLMEKYARENKAFVLNMATPPFNAETSDLRGRLEAAKEVITALYDRSAAAYNQGLEDGMSTADDIRNAYESRISEYESQILELETELQRRGWKK